MKSTKLSKALNKVNNYKSTLAWPFLARRIVGHSMLPALPPGTLVFCARFFRKLSPGDIVIFNHDGKEKIKRVHEIDKSGKIYLLGDHSSASTDSRHFGKLERHSVIAKVVWPKDPKD